MFFLPSTKVRNTGNTLANTGSPNEILISSKRYNNCMPLIYVSFFMRCGLGRIFVDLQDKSHS